MKPPLIQFENVSKRFDTLEVLRGVELSVFQGEVTAIIGKSGEGKSVLLKHMIGLMLPDAGEIFFNGRPLSKMKRSETNRLWEKFSYVFQDAALFDFMTVGDNIAFPLQQGTSLPKADMRKRVQDKLQLFELQEFQDKYPSQISGGMKRRVALARALVTDPEVVLLDEPTTGLDPIRTNAVYSMIVDFQKNFGFTAVMISHQIPDIFYFSNRIAMLDEGRIRFEGTPEEILHFPDPTVQQFIQGLERPRDALTGMATPVQAEKKVQEKLVHLQRHRIVFSVVMFTVENLAVINEKVGHVAGQTILKNFAAQIKQRLDIADSSSRYSLDRILVVLHNADIDDARTFATRLARELKVEDLIPGKKDADLCVRISAGYAQAEEDSLIKEVLAKAESKDNLYYEIELK
ncbi:MAG: ATP-binding cassette domain-containing protein [Desulfobacterales bacterium]|jgi:phospholipid/cholesterol/gamma-HCH transport system ATP-binding protein